MNILKKIKKKKYKLIINSSYKDKEIFIIQYECTHLFEIKKNFFITF